MPIPTTPPGLGVSTRRAGITNPGVKFSTLGVEFSTLGLVFTNPGLVFTNPGLVNANPGLVLPEAGTEKKEASPGVGLPPAVITKVSIVSQNGKSGFPILTFRESLRAWKNAADGPDFADFPFAGTRLALHLQRAGAHRAAPARRLFGVDCLPHTVKASARRARQACQNAGLRSGSCHFPTNTFLS